MKDLSEYINESILSGDDELDKREVFDIKVKNDLPNAQLKEFKQFKTVDEKVIKDVVIDVLKELNIIKEDIIAIIRTAMLDNNDEYVQIVVKHKDEFLFALSHADDANGDKNFMWKFQRGWSNSFSKSVADKVMKKINKKYK